MSVGILLHEALRSLLEFLDRLIRKVCQLLLERIALVRGRLQKLNLCLFLLFDESTARREVRFESLYFAFRFFRLLRSFLIFGALLGGNVLEIQVYFGFRAAHYLALRRIRLIRRRQLDVDRVNAGPQIAKCVIPVLVRLRVSFGALLTNNLNTDIEPRFAANIQDLPADRAVALSCGARCKYA